MEKQTAHDFNADELDALIKRVEHAEKYNLALSPEDTKLLLNALLMLVHLQQRLSHKDVTLHKLRKLLGLTRSSEKLKDLAPDSTNDEEQDPKPQRSPRGKPPELSEESKVKPEVIHHHHDELKKGEACPLCETGTLYKYEPATLLRIIGKSPFKPEQHVRERLRCNACGEFFTAPLPDEVRADGEGLQMYGYSARSIISIQKCFGGTPFHRLGSLQSLFGVPLSASTAFDQMEYLGNDIAPVHSHLLKLSANADVFCADDTHNRILNQKPVMKKARRGKGERLRKGVNTSGVIARLPEGQEVVIYQTNIGHTGEFLDELLGKRREDTKPPVLMSDALSSNRPTLRDVTHALCNSHSRRQFVDVHPHYPDEVTPVLVDYAEIWKHETYTRDENMSSSERLAYHKEHSLPVMKRIKGWCEAQFQSDMVEENSSLGKAINYFIKHYPGLTEFCKTKDAPLDNNLIEGLLKIPIRNRKNAMFYKTLAGAAISDVVTSVIATCMRSGVNAFDYLNTLQRNKAAVRAEPQNWLPWNYLAQQAPTSV